MRDIDTIIVHCADTYKGMDIGVDDIDGWHRTRGWDSVGYHFVITRSGGCQEGRPLEKQGAHTRGENENSIGICLVGGKGADGSPEFNFTRRQMEMLEKLIYDLLLDYPGLDVRGHNDYADKACPCFDVQAWWYSK